MAGDISGGIRNVAIPDEEWGIDAELVVCWTSAEVAEALFKYLGYSLEIESFRTALIAPLKKRADRIVIDGIHIRYDRR
ncbi:MAG: hypothetical protein KF841_10570 [Phycisphaerae bacterium]|nr:hypothetical protein [Phycisphaerae bacterium]